MAAPRLAAHPAGHRALRAPEEERAALRVHLEQGTQRVAAAHVHPRAGREARGGARRRGQSDRRLGDALRQAVDGGEAERAAGGGLRAHPALSPLPAIQRKHDRNGERRRFRRAEGDAPAAGAADSAALFRRSGLYRRAGRERRAAPRRARLRARKGDRLLSRPAGILSRKGDPYHCHCQKTSRLLAERLGWGEGRLLTTFQSRFGPEEWLKPYTDETVKRLAGEGVRRIAIVNPGFVSDCLETLEEIAVQNAEIFRHHGGERFSAYPLPEQFAGRYAGDHDGRAARVAGLDLSQRACRRGASSRTSSKLTLQG